MKTTKEELKSISVMIVGCQFLINHIDESLDRAPFWIKRRAKQKSKSLMHELVAIVNTIFKGKEVGTLNAASEINNGAIMLHAHAEALHELMRKKNPDGMSQFIAEYVQLLEKHLAE